MTLRTKRCTVGSQVAEGEPDHRLGRVATALVDEFVAGGLAKRVVHPGVEVGQGTEDVFRRYAFRDRLRHGADLPPSG